ncbi:MAG TPA: hypothetical protein VLA12_05275 [Planctomycetaceae bacterium]|nr:hypothetical protein [Planctomycetaceae bacterium]
MAIDSKQKRMSAMNLACPWRGPVVDATESGTTQGNRQAAAFYYSGILAGEVETLDPTKGTRLQRLTKITDLPAMTKVTKLQRISKVTR